MVLLCVIIVQRRSYFCLHCDLNYVAYLLLFLSRCLKEGAKDFLLKPVKLADVKRIKQLIMRNEAEECKTLSLSNKRKLGEEDIDTTSPSSSSSSSSHAETDVKDIPSSKRMKSESENLSSLL